MTTKLLLNSRSKRVSFALTLAITMASGTFLSFALGALAPFLVEDLGITRGQLGIAVMAFLLTGALASPVMGRVVDIQPPRRLVFILLWFVLVSFVAVSSSANFHMLVWVALVSGVYGAVTNPVTNQLIGLHLPVGGQGAVMGAKLSGVQLGTFLAGAALPPLAQLFGWRAALALASALPLCGLIGARLSIPKAKFQRVSWTDGVTLVGVMRDYPIAKWLAVYAGLMGTGTSAIGVYLPLYGYERVGMGVTMAGFAAAMVGLIGMPARILWGRFAEQRPLRLSNTLGALGIASSFGIIAIAAAAELGRLFVFVGVAILGPLVVGWNVLIMLFIVTNVLTSATGGITGIIMFAFYLGLAIGPGIFALALTSSGDYLYAWLLDACIFLTAGLLAVIWGRSTDEPGSG